MFLYGTAVHCVEGGENPIYICARLAKDVSVSCENSSKMPDFRWLFVI